MATVAEWENYFRGLTPEQRESLFNAVVTLRDNPMFNREFKWTGLFELADSITYAGVFAPSLAAYYKGFLLQTEGSKILAFRNSQMRAASMPAYVEETVDEVEIAIDKANDEGAYQTW